LKLEQLQENVTRKKKSLDNEVTETLTAQVCSPQNDANKCEVSTP